MSNLSRILDASKKPHEPTESKHERVSHNRTTNSDHGDSDHIRSPSRCRRLHKGRELRNAAPEKRKERVLGEENFPCGAEP